MRLALDLQKLQQAFEKGAAAECMLALLYSLHKAVAVVEALEYGIEVFYVEHCDCEWRKMRVRSGCDARRDEIDVFWSRTLSCELCLAQLSSCSFLTTSIHIRLPKGDYSDIVNLIQGYIHRLDRALKVVQTRQQRTHCIDLAFSRSCAFSSLSLPVFATPPVMLAAITSFAYPSMPTSAL